MLDQIVFAEELGFDSAWFGEHHYAGYSFGAPAVIGVGGGPFDLAVGDLDRDGKPDIAVANAGTNNISVFVNNRPIAGPLSFQPAATYILRIDGWVMTAPISYKLRVVRF